MGDIASAIFVVIFMFFSTCYNKTAVAALNMSKTPITFLAIGVLLLQWGP